MFGAMDATKPYEFLAFGAMAVTKPHEFIRFGPPKISSDRHGRAVDFEIGVGDRLAPPQVPVKGSCAGGNPMNLYGLGPGCYQTL